MKERWDLVPWAILEDMVKVLTFGAEKHTDDGWKDLPYDFHFEALMRHISEWRKGHVLDEESNLPHLAHAMCRLMFLSYLDCAPASVTSPLEFSAEQLHNLRNLSHLQLRRYPDQDPSTKR